MAHKKTIYFRADGDGKIGYGHVIRSLALVDMLKGEFHSVFIAKESTRLLEHEIKKYCDEIIWIPNEITLEKEALFLATNVLHNTIAVLDGYFFDTAYQLQFKTVFDKVVCIDDLHAFPFVADVVINQSGSVSHSDYVIDDKSVLHTGLDYVLLRKPFLTAAKSKRNIQFISQAFICFGGSDYSNLTCKALEAIMSHAAVTRIHIVIGGAYLFKKKLFSMIASSPIDVVVYEQISAEEICEIMQQCQIAIAPSSSVSFELCSVGVGLVCGYYVENQKDIYQFAKENEMIIPAGDLNEISVRELSLLIPSLDNIYRLLQNQKQYFNGQSANNYLKLFQSLC